MALTYNQPRFTQTLLTKYKKCVPSFTINLYDDHWTLNKGPSKFLYTQPVSGLLDEVRALRIPVDFIEIFDMAHIPYYEGCMIVESIDHRKPRLPHQQTQSKEPECVRVVLQPNAESFYADLCLLNAKSGNKWTDQEALEVESKILVGFNATCPPLCLDPDINLTRIVNTVIRASTPSDSVLSKRKQVHEPEEDENDKAKRAKLWSQYMHPHNGKPSSQVCVLAFFDPRLIPQLNATKSQNKRSMFDILHEVAQKDEKGTYSLKWKQPKNEPTAFHQQGQPQNNQTFVPPNAVNPMTASSAVPSTATPAQDDPKAKAKVKAGKKAEGQEPQPTMTKGQQGKKKPVTNSSLPVPAPSPVPEQRKVGPVIPGVSRTPVDPNTMRAGSPNPPAQFQQLPQPSVSPHPPVLSVSAPPIADNKQSKKKGVLKKPEEPSVQPQAHQPQPLPANHMDPQPGWQPPIPSAQYLSQPPQGKKKPPAQQPQQASSFHALTPVSGFANSNGFPQNSGYKPVGGMGQNQMNPNRGSPMAHNQPLLSRSPLPPHSQSPHPPPQQPQQGPPLTQQHPMPQHSVHQFNMHLPQNRFNPAMQGQPGHHPHAVTQHPVPQQHHPQHPNAPRAGQAHDHSAMMQAQMQQQQQQQQYAMQQQYPYSQMHVQNMMNGARLQTIPSGQAAGGQYMTHPGWRPAGGRGGGPMTTVPMAMAHGQHFAQQPMLPGMGRGQPQQTQPQSQGR